MCFWHAALLLRLTTVAGTFPLGSLYSTGLRALAHRSKTGADYDLDLLERLLSSKADACCDLPTMRKMRRDFDSSDFHDWSGVPDVRRASDQLTYFLALELVSNSEAGSAALQKWVKSQKIHIVNSLEWPDGHDRAYDGCPGVFAMVSLCMAESLIVKLLPVASADAHWTTWASTMREILQLFVPVGQLIRRHVRSTSYDPASPLHEAMLYWHARARRRLGILHVSFSEPWYPKPGKLRLWLRLGDMLRTFISAGRPAQVPVGRTPATLPDQLQIITQRNTFGQTGGMGLGSSSHAQRSALGDLVQALRAVRRRFSSREELPKELETMWWPIKGSAIAMLRHGAWHGNLAKGKVDIVDIDMDFSILVGSPALWFKICVFLTDFLISKGWEGCSHHTFGWYLSGHGPEGTAWNVPSPNQTTMDGRGASLLTCAKLHPSSNAWVQFELLWNKVMQLVQPGKAGQEDCDACAGRTPDVNNGCDNFPKGPEVWLRKLFWLKEKVRQHMLTGLPSQLHGFVVTTNVVCEIGSNRCFLAGTYPHQCWSGGIPLGCIYPQKRCGAYNVSVACARCNRHEIKWFNHGKYWARHPSRPCLALPMIFGRSEHSVSRGLYHDRNWVDGRNLLLHQDGITDEDVQVLETTSQMLRSRGFDTFGPEDRAECAPAVDGRRSSILVIDADACLPDCNYSFQSGETGSEGYRGY
ncbi:SHL2 [Symbiodinium natans]|uniref:SHL2 protein n=1 Tax=Symbiodinium natans TaxID=878477 RepID=A0A812VE60_9DINO|nr:SHL2 [Symbiodinium natans]